MEEKVIVTMTLDEFRGIIKEEVTAALEAQQTPSIKELPPLLTRLEVMELLQISSTKATELFKRPDFKVFREGKILVETSWLLEWVRENSF